MNAHKHDGSKGTTKEDVLIKECKDEVSSPRAWLENHPDGAYSVLRVEMSASSEPRNNVPGDASSTVARLWGYQFHLDRLEHSFQKKWLKDDQPTDKSMDGATLKKARNETWHILHRLLENAAEGLEKIASCKSTTFMATILWYPTGNDRSKIKVHGHLLERQQQSPFVNETTTITPIVATLAADLSNPATKLPNRYDQGLADCKLSRWCRERRPLEQQFKQSSSPLSQEVLLTRPKAPSSSPSVGRNMGTVEVLEGLTSNAFFIEEIHNTTTNRKQATVHTAPTCDALPGFARHMAIQSLRRLGYTVIDSACPTFKFPPAIVAKQSEVIDEVEDAAVLWSEVFVTSAISLVTPVKIILEPSGETPMWKQQTIKDDEQNDNRTSQSVAQRVYQDILENRQDWIDVEIKF